MARFTIIERACIVELWLDDCIIVALPRGDERATVLLALKAEPTKVTLHLDVKRATFPLPHGDGV